MEIIVAGHAGFCFGVSRTVDMLSKALELPGIRLAALGEVIHNPVIVEEFKNRGVRFIKNPGEAEYGETVFIRSHGAREEIFSELRSRGIGLIDGTCPFVAKIHREMERARAEGRGVLLLGDSGHPEVTGILGYAPEPAFVLGGYDELETFGFSMTLKPDFPLLMAAQTTFDINEWDRCVNFAEKHYTNMIISDTICNATEIRQKEADRLSKECSAVVVIGAKNSSNTRKLREICIRNCDRVYHIETAGDIEPEIIKGVSRMGITAGASTPERIIKEVIKRMSDMDQEINKEELLLPEDAAETAEEETPEVPVGQEAEASEPEPSASAERQDDVIFEQAFEDSLKVIHNGDKIRGTVVSVNAAEVQVELGLKQTGFIPASEISDDPSINPEDLFKPGDTVEAVVVQVNDQEGVVTLSKSRADAVRGWETVEEAEASGAVIEGVVREAVKGGVVVRADGVRVFIPASQTGMAKDADLSVLVNRKVHIKIIETNRGRKKAVGSIRLAENDMRRSTVQKFWAEAEVGKRYNGTVKSITSFGVFVDIGGVDGMAHISELSWERTKNPTELFKPGDPCTVMIKSLDPEAKRISLTCRLEEDDPWKKFIASYKVGDILTVKIMKLMPFGAFAQVIPGVDGLIHISQIAEQRIQKPQDVLEVGSEVRVKITGVNDERRKISLSMKASAEEAEAWESDSDAGEPADSAEASPESPSAEAIPETAE